MRYQTILFRKYGQNCGFYEPSTSRRDLWITLYVEEYMPGMLVYNMHIIVKYRNNEGERSDTTWMNGRKEEKENTKVRDRVKEEERKREREK